MPLRRLSMLGFGLVLLAAPVQATPCRPTCDGNGEHSTKHDRDASSIQIERTQHPVRAIDIPQVQLSNLPPELSNLPGRSVDLSGRSVDSYAPGLQKKHHRLPSGGSVDSYAPGLQKKHHRLPSGGSVDSYAPGLQKKHDRSPSHPRKSVLEPSTGGLPHGPGPAVPEPTALLLFGVGLLALHSVRSNRLI